MASYRHDFGLAPDWQVFCSCGPLNPANLIVFLYLFVEQHNQGFLSVLAATAFFFTVPASLATALFLSPWSLGPTRPPAEDSLWPLVGSATAAAFIYSFLVSSVFFFPFGILFGIPVGLAIALLPGGLFVVSARILLGWLDERQRLVDQTSP